MKSIRSLMTLTVAALLLPAIHTRAATFSIVHSFGVLTNVPLVWLALAVPLAWRGRSGQSASILRWFVTAVVLLFGVLAELPATGKRPLLPERFLGRIS